jgi:capsular exopolysaccharide synthesis family protein
METIDSLNDIDLSKYWLVLKRRWLPALCVSSLIITSATLFAYSRDRIYRAETKLLLKSNRTSSLTGLGEELGQLEGLNFQNNPLQTQAEVVRSIPTAQEAIAALDLRNDEGNLLNPEQLANDLQVEEVIGTDVLTIAYQSTDPEKAAAIVNKVAETYIQNTVEINREEAAAAREFIVEQLPKTEAAVRQADSNLRQFKEVNRIIALDQEASSMVGIIVGLNDQITQAQSQLVSTTARSNDLRQKIGADLQQAVSLVSLNQASGVQEVRGQLQTAQAELAVEATRYQPGHPKIANLERRVTALNSLLQERIIQVIGSNPGNVGDLQLSALEESLIDQVIQAEAERLALQERINLLTNTRTTYEARATNLPRLEQTQRELERQRQAAQTTYETLLTRLQEIQVAENQTIGNARVISPALVPTTAVGPSKKRILGGGLLLGTMLGVATAFALDLLDRSIKTIREARELLGYPLLGVIPALNRFGKVATHPGQVEPSILSVVVRDYPRSIGAEAYQMLQANLRFLSSDEPLRAIVVTSSVANEGKSQVSANLAAAIAQLGRRVLLVDADMRRPAQHHVWDLTNLVGLSNVMVDQASLEQAICPVMPNLDVLPAGVVPPNPIALLDSKRMVSLVETFTAHYDCVIFDTPPLVGTADSALLGKLTDGILLVVRPDVVDSNGAKAAKEFLIQSHQTVLGMVMNGVNIKREPDSYFYHYTRQADDALQPSASAALLSSSSDRSNC